MSKLIDEHATDVTRRRYQRLSMFYDLMEGMAEKRYAPWRKRLWSLVGGQTVLEAGVGTGKNIGYYPGSSHITAIDLTPSMLAYAQQRIKQFCLHSRVSLQLGDVQALDFPNSTFDTALATFVFCSVPDPVLGLQELKRVVKPGGKILLLEHMRSANSFLAALMDWLNPLVVRLMGANINRDTVGNVRRAGLNIEHVDDLDPMGIFKIIVARV